MATNDIRRGEIYLVDWHPSRGSEQAGVRPSLIIQNDVGNGVRAYPITIVLSISSQIKGYPAMVLVEPTETNGLTKRSEINTGQITSIDKQRLIKYVGSLDKIVLQEVERKLAYMLGFAYDQF